MKKILPFSVLMLLCLAATAQDRIVLKNGSTIIAEVDTITRYYLRYHPIISLSDGGHRTLKNQTMAEHIKDLDSVILSSGRVLFASSKGILASPQTKDPYRVEPSPNPNIHPQYKNPAYAYLLSTIPGCGQFYNDQVTKGLTFIAIDAGASALFLISYYASSAAASPEGTTLANVGMVSAAITGFVAYFWSAIDAVITANNWNIANGYVLSASPTLSYNHLVPTGDNAFAAGLSLSLSF